MAKVIKFLIIKLVVAAIVLSRTTTARGGCRFHPSCSHYALEAFSKHNLARALFLVCRRILRCNPFSQSTYDPVPERQPPGEKVA